MTNRGKPATGECREIVGGFEARITIEGKKRRGFLLPNCKDKPAARERTTAMATFAYRLRTNGLEEHIEKTLEMAARARDGRPWQAVVTAVDALCAGTTLAVTAVPTVTDFAKEWTDGTLRRRFPDHVREKDPTEDERYFRLYINPVIGPLRVDEVTLADADGVMANLPERLGASARRHVAQSIHRLLGFAVYPARHRAVSPIPKNWLPQVKSSVAFTSLYPDEEGTLMG